ncbi:c-type cytochrome biogenesis protein CcmI [Aestuariivirga sp.]|uniref:c-type cytochrome biogenesis protein CcmI n=1 Tax=Aestuariivirga sp. TaxID=2650926 RepID=UPI0039E3CD96
MMIWLIFAGMTMAVMAALLLPVLRMRADSGVARSAYDRAVFRDQLAELDRDVIRGTIGAAEAEAARNEISRRILQVPELKAAAVHRGFPIAALLGVLIVPAVAMGLYLWVGTPRLPDVPLAARLDNAVANGDLDAMVVKVERHMAEKPDDLRGWEVLASTYRKAGRYDDAAAAFANILRLSPKTPELLSNYGEMLYLANQGMVTAEAHRAFSDALALDPKFPMARYFAALALKQEGKQAEALAAFQSFLADSPADAPWRSRLEKEIAGINASPPALTDEQMSAGAAMSAGDQAQMIHGMVDGLEAKLKADGSDLAGWQKLIRARTVLGETDKAKAALASARAAFTDKPDAQAALDGLARELNLL